MSLIELDLVDKKILRQLQDNGKKLNTELADEVGLTPAPCLRRVKRLEQEGVIDRYEAKLNAKKLGIDLTVFVTVTLDQQDTKLFESFTQAMCEKAEVQECHLILGEGDFLLKIRVKDLEEYQKFLLEHVTGSHAVRSVHSAIAIKTDKESSQLAI